MSGAKRVKCPVECACLCHDTGHTMQHGEHRVCPTKLGQPLVPLELEVVSS